MRPRTCPTHRAPMQRLIATTSAGQALELDRCADCGGLWFDAGELELLATHRALAGGPGFEHFCPSCADPAHEPAVGGQFAAARCNGCQGTWLDGATVAGLDARLPRPPDASQKPSELGFLCAGCDERFPYEQGHVSASGLVCRPCLKGGTARPPQALGSTFDAVLRFLTGTD